MLHVEQPHRLHQPSAEKLDNSEPVRNNQELFDVSPIYVRATQVLTSADTEKLRQAQVLKSGGTWNISEVVKLCYRTTKQYHRYCIISSLPRHLENGAHSSIN